MKPSTAPIPGSADDAALVTGVFERALSVQELAEELHVSAQTIYDLRSQGRGPAGFRVGRHLRFRARMSGEITVGVRPEAWRIVSADAGGLLVTVTVVEKLGSDAFICGTCVGRTPGSVIVRVTPRDSVSKGDVVHLTTRHGSPTALGFNPRRSLRSCAATPARR